MQKIFPLIIIFSIGSFLLSFSQSVHISYNKNSPQEFYAARMLLKSLKVRKFNIKESNADFNIDLSIDGSIPGSEAYFVYTSQKSISVSGSNERGLIYGTLELAEKIRNGSALKDI